MTVYTLYILLEDHSSKQKILQSMRW